MRLEVKKAKQHSEALVEQLEAELKSYEYMARLWNEFEPGLISVTDVKLKTVKIAGVPVPALEEVLYDVKDINLFTKPMWYADGVQIPGYIEAIRKIKRYMEDAENLDKASQKIVKNKHIAEEEAEHGN